MKREAVIVAAARTPVGKCRGALAPVKAQTLGALTVKEVIRRSGVEPESIDDVVFANLFNTEAANMARVVALEAGLPYSVPALTIDRQCASSLNSMAYAAAMIEAGHADIIIAGGVESDSRRNYIVPKADVLYQVTPPQPMVSGYCAPGELGVNMGTTAENVAERYGITRQECDEFALWSHQKAAKAWENGYFDSQIVPVEVDKGKGKVYVVTKDESVRADTTPEALAALKPAFKKDGIVTSGNSSPMSDGAGAAVVMGREIAESYGYKAMYKIKGFAFAGVDPLIMGIGPVEATRKLFKKTGMSFSDIDLIEMNEAFASQSLACIRELNMPVDKLNVNGGAIALGHPLAGTGGVLLTKMFYELERRGLGTGLISFCIGGGQGAAAIIERI